MALDPLRVPQVRVHKVADKAEQLQGALGMVLPISSAYRSPEHNRKVGGAKRSRHMQGDAIDFDVSGMPREERLRIIEEAITPRL